MKTRFTEHSDCKSFCLNLTLDNLPMDKIKEQIVKDLIRTYKLCR